MASGSDDSDGCLRQLGSVPLGVSCTADVRSTAPKMRRRRPGETHSFEIWFHEDAELVDSSGCGKSVETSNRVLTIVLNRVTSIVGESY